MADPSSVVYISAATVWELPSKAFLGKLDLNGADLVEEIGENDFIELPITARNSVVAATLPRHHDDPFDRMLIAQARIEGLTVVTRDPAFSRVWHRRPSDLKPQSTSTAIRMAEPRYSSVSQ